MKPLKRYAQALDLVDDPVLIAEYEEAHVHIWPEVRDHLRHYGVVEMEIYRFGARLFMLMEVDPECFDGATFARASGASPVIQHWESLMWKYQKPVPGAGAGEKWVPMQRIFSLQTQ